MVRSVQFLWAIALALCLCWGQASAGTTGKIAGVVKDAKGQPLAGVNVVVQGTTRGAVTDANGNYVILNLDPGQYTLTASMIGYNKQSRKDVGVSADRTTRVDFALAETAVTLGEVTVTAERPPVEVDRTSSTYSMDSRMIEQTPVAKDVTRLLELQGGVNLDGKLSIRGNQGSAGYWGGQQVEIYVDGVPMQGAAMYKPGGLGATSTGANDFSPFLGATASSIGELSVIAGGYGAEYGGAGGVVNVITKGIPDGFHGRIEYKVTPPGKKHWGSNVYDEQNPLWWNVSNPALRRMKWSDPNWVNETVTYTDALTGQSKTVPAHQKVDYTGVWGHWTEVTLSGPITDKVRLLVSGNLDRTAPFLPAAKSYGFFANKASLGRGEQFKPGAGAFQGNAKLTTQLTPSLKATFGATYRWLNTIDDWANLRNGASGLFMVDYEGAEEKEGVTMLYGTLSHTLSPRTFYELRVSWYRDVIDTAKAAFNTPQLLPILADPVTDKDKFFTVYPGKRTQFLIQDNRRLRVAADLTSQVTRHHLIKAGFTMSHDQFASLHAGWGKSGPRAWEWTGKDYFYQVGTPLSDALRGTLETAVFAQDKMEFEGLVVNLGVRYDRFDHLNKYVPMGAGLWFVNPATFSWTKSRYAPLVKMSPLQELSPRFGVSHPITKSSIIRLAFTQTRTLPSMRLLYTNGWCGGSGGLSAMDLNKNGKVDPDEFMANNNTRGWAGNGELTYATSTSFEVGTDWNFYQDYVLALTTYYRSGTGEISGGNPYWWDPQTGSTVRGSQGFYNQNITENRGYEFSLRKGFLNNFSFMLSFNQQWQFFRHLREHQILLPDSKAIASGQWYWTKFTVDPATGKEVPVPLTPQEVQTLGAKADAKLQAIRDHTDPEWDPLFSSELMPSDLPGLWFYRLRYVPGFSVISNQPSDYQVVLSPRGWGKASFTYNSPSARGPVWGDWRVNLIYSLGEHGAFGLPTSAGPQVKYGPIQTNVDMAVEKDIKLRSGPTLTLYAVITNLLNNEEPSFSYSFDSPGAVLDWYNMGLVAPRPDNATYIQRGGDPNYLTRYRGNPRLLDFGLRVNF